MIQKDFTPPKPHISERETTKRIKIIEDILPELIKYSSAICLTGSMAYGQDFSVTPESDIDLQLMTTPELIGALAKSKFTQKYNTTRIIEGFMSGVFVQFSIQCRVKEIPISLHFWDEKTYREILEGKHTSVIRMRSQKKKISTDYSYSFDGAELVQTFPDYKEGEYHLGVFPVMTHRDGSTFFSRPLTNIIGNTIVLYDTCGWKEAIDTSLAMITQQMSETPHEPGKTYSLYNTLPGKNKVSPEVREMMEQ